MSLRTLLGCCVVRGAKRALSLVILMLCTGPARAQLSDHAPLSRAELSRLRRGECVQRRTTEARGGLYLLGGTSYQLVDAPAEAVWRAVTDDAQHLKHMLPAVERSRLVRARGDAARVVRFEHEVGIASVRYSLEFEYDHTHKVVLFRLDESAPHDIRAAWGFFRIRSFDEHRTVITFGTLVDIGDGIVNGLLRPTVHDWILKIPWTMKRYIEGSGRTRYVREA